MLVFTEESFYLLLVSDNVRSYIIIHTNTQQVYEKYKKMRLWYRKMYFIYLIYTEHIFVYISHLQLENSNVSIKQWRNNCIGPIWTRIEDRTTSSRRALR